MKDGNDYAQVTQALEPLLVLARDTGAHVLCVHHLGKAAREGGDAILGSTAIFSSVDTAIILKRTREERTITSIQRYGVDLEETALTYDKSARTLALGGTMEEETILRVQDRILDYLRGNADPVRKEELDEDIEGRHEPKREALRRLVVAGRVTRQGKGRRDDPFVYALAPSMHPGSAAQMGRGISP